MGKGSNARPIEVPRDEFVGRWDLIFGKKDIKEEVTEEEKVDKVSSKIYNKE